MKLSVIAIAIGCVSLAWAEPQSVTIKTLMDSPDVWSGRDIRIQAFLVQSLEHSFLSDKKEDTGFMGIWVDGLPTDLQSRMFRLWSTSEKQTFVRVPVVIEGKFESGTETLTINGEKVVFGKFGHLGCASMRITARKVIELGAIEAYESPNHSPEATTLARTPAAEAPVAPAVGRASS
jgi:hypothetical protein